jgi:very-short-patch-repair endonuclease
MCVSLTMRHRPFIPYRTRSISRARALRREATAAERKLWHEFLRLLPEKFTRQKPLGRYIADFYCSSKRLVIEIDGDSHFSDAGENYDEARTQALAEHGLRVIRFTNNDVMENFDAACERIVEALSS